MTPPPHHKPPSLACGDSADYADLWHACGNFNTLRWLTVTQPDLFASTPDHLREMGGDPRKKLNSWANKTHQKVSHPVRVPLRASRLKRCKRPRDSDHASVRRPGELGTVGRFSCRCRQDVARGGEIFLFRLQVP